MKRYLVWGLVIMALIFAGCGSVDKIKPAFSAKLKLKDPLLLNSGREVFIWDKSDGKWQKKGSFKNQYFMNVALYDEENKAIIAASYEPTAKHAGLTYYLGENKLTYEDMENFGPMHAVIYRGKLFGDSARIIQKDGVTGTVVGEFDLKQKKFIKRIAIPGTVQNLYQEGSIIYFTSYVAEKSLSNIYQYDFNTQKLTKLLNEDQHWLPEELVFDSQNQVLYGLYPEATKEGVEKDKANQVVRIKQGEMEKICSVPPNAAQIEIHDNVLFILHRKENGQIIKKPLGMINLNTEEYFSLPIKLGFTGTMWVKDDQLFVSDLTDHTVKIYQIGTWKLQQTLDINNDIITIR